MPQGDVNLRVALSKPCQVEWRVVEVYHIVDRIRSVGRLARSTENTGFGYPVSKSCTAGGSAEGKSRVSILGFVSYKENQQIPWQPEFSRLVKTMLLGGPDEGLMGPLFG